MKGFGYVAQLFQALDVVFNNAYLLFSVLGQIIHLAYLHDEVFLGLAIRKGVQLVKGLGYVDGGERCLVIQRHLKLEAGRRVIL